MPEIRFENRVNYKDRNSKGIEKKLLLQWRMEKSTQKEMGAIVVTISGNDTCITQLGLGQDYKNR